MSIMRIQSIELENYRQFRGKTTIEFACNPRRSITVIHGANGSGKTNLLSAINWCLYAREGRLSRCKEYQRIINDAELHKLASGQRAYTRVALKIHNKILDCCYRFERKTGASKDPNNGVVFDYKSEFNAYEEDKGHSQETPEPNDLVRNILPYEAKSCFFFNGAQLPQFLNKMESGQARDVTELYWLDKAIHQLEKTVSAIEASETKEELLAIGDDLQGIVSLLALMRARVFWSDTFDSKYLDSLSSSDRHLLALYDVWMLQKESGIGSPVIIDTPLAIIDSGLWEQAAKWFLQFAKTTQVILLMNDTEYCPLVRRLLSKRVGKEYELLYDEKSGQTSVREAQLRS